MLGIVGMYLFAWFLSAWTLMITVGIAHNDWWALIPPMGYGTAIAMTFLPVLFRFIDQFFQKLS